MTRRRVLVALGVWAVLVISLWASRSSPAILVLGGVVAVVAASILAMVDLTRTVARVEWSRRSRRVHSSRSDDARVGALRRQVHGARWTGSTEINDTLVDLVDDRLLAHHRIDRASDPAAAMEALTPTLRRLVSGPRRRTASMRELEQILTEIEAL